MTFGIAPTQAATGYGYLELGRATGAAARVVRAVQGKARRGHGPEVFAAGPERYLWNSGMFVWRAATLLECIRRYVPANPAGLARIAEAWDCRDREQCSARSIRRCRRSASITR